MFNPFRRKKKKTRNSRPFSSRHLTGRDATRELVRIRDNYTCQSCFKRWEEGKRRFDIHHLNGVCGKKSKNYDRVEDMDGLITFCHNCHMNQPEVREKLGRIISQQGIIRRKRFIERDAELVEAYVSNATLTPITLSKKYGVSRQRIHQILKRNGVTVTRRIPLIREIWTCSSPTCKKEFSTIPSSKRAYCERSCMWDRRNYLASIVTEKICADCKTTKPRDSFGRRVSGKGTVLLLSYCKSCMNIRSDDWKERNPEKFNDYHRRYYKMKKKS